jgi:hypothetical protein
MGFERNFVDLKKMNTCSKSCTGTAVLCYKKSLLDTVQLLNILFFVQLYDVVSI